MLKTAMLVSALALSAPAFAQDQKPAGREPMTTAPETPTTVPATDATTQQAPTNAAQTAPATDPMAPAQAPTETAATPTAPADATVPTDVAAATPAAGTAEPAAVTGASQIAQVVNTEFPTYDKNADTNLDKTEFGAWMVALKTASDPATKATDPATAKWIEGAFASADADKSKMVSKDELTKYLSQGAE